MVFTHMHIRVYTNKKFFRVWFSLPKQPENIFAGENFLIYGSMANVSSCYSSANSDSVSVCANFLMGSEFVLGINSTKSCPSALWANLSAFFNITASAFLSTSRHAGSFVFGLHGLTAWAGYYHYDQHVVNYRIAGIFRRWKLLQILRFRGNLQKF